MDNINKYYETTLKKIDDLLVNKQYQEAFEIINQEIASPYIPEKYVKQFEQLYVDTNKIIMIESIKNQYNKMSKMEMLAKIYHHHKLDVNLFSFMLGKFHREIDQVDLQYIEKIFQDKQIHNSEKIFLLEQLQLANINFVFCFYNNVLNRVISINVHDKFLFKDHPYFVKVKKDVEHLLFKDPSMDALCNELLTIVYEYYFNLPAPFETNVLANKLVQYVKTYFNANVTQDAEFKVWIEQIMQSKKILN